jgi:hypothetical protein
MSNHTHAEQDTFQEPTAERLAGLGAGCFVQIHRNEECEWVEITGGEGNEFVGMLHPALSTPLPTETTPALKEAHRQAQAAANEELQLCKEQITALGCDRYCVC